MCNDTIFIYILINTCLLETRHKLYILLCSYYTTKNVEKEKLKVFRPYKDYPNVTNLNNRYISLIFNLK